ncbi:glycosyltransferase [Inquilinus sp. KBS0705]|nr:glycosyltransferase [Inquilinus sp. KBS0705]
MLNIAAVIVTNNRLALLQEAVEALRLQTYLPTTIIVVNNDSNDGTHQWLDAQTDITVIHQQNLGGSGGFYTGIKAATANSADWIWLMDDDTICQPDTLLRLVEKLPFVEEPVGFIGSKCIWTDGNPHLMNIPVIKNAVYKNTPFNKYDSKGLLLAEMSSFVSILINAEAVRAVGLPYKEFFIWGDDQEYTKRITNNNYLGLYCFDSLALHKTKVNYFPDFYNDTVPNLWKHSYGFRNEFFMAKQNKGLFYYSIWLIKTLIVKIYNILRIRKGDKFKFISVVLNSAWRSVFFDPKIDKIV